MKNFLKIRKAILLAMSMTLALVTFSGCEKDKDKADPRDAYVGTYRNHERVPIDGVMVDDYYNITITKSTVNESDIVITNLLDMGAGISVIATVTGNNFNIPQQSVTLESQGAGISGSGRRDPATNILTYSVMATITGYSIILNFDNTATKM